MLFHLSGGIETIENANNPRYRIVLAGYDGEHDMPSDWRRVEWTARRSYGNTSGKTANSDNRKRERLWLSPNCIYEMDEQ